MVPTEEGALWLSKLYKHGNSWGHEMMGDETAAAEECEREVEQEEEKQQEIEIESVLPRLRASGEQAWASPWSAVQLSSATDIPGSQRIQVHTRNRQLFFLYAAVVYSATSDLARAHA